MKVMFYVDDDEVKSDKSGDASTQKEAAPNDLAEPLGDGLMKHELDVTPSGDVEQPKQDYPTVQESQLCSLKVCWLDNVCYLTLPLGKGLSSPEATRGYATVQAAKCKVLLYFLAMRVHT